MLWETVEPMAPDGPIPRPRVGAVADVTYDVWALQTFWRRLEERGVSVLPPMPADVEEVCVGNEDPRAGEPTCAFSAPSQVTYYMQHLVMAGVIADAAMVDGTIERDVYCRRDPEELRGG